MCGNLILNGEVAWTIFLTYIFRSENHICHKIRPQPETSSRRNIYIPINVLCQLLFNQVFILAHISVEVYLPLRCLDVVQPVSMSTVNRLTAALSSDTKKATFGGSGGGWYHLNKVWEVQLGCERFLLTETVLSASQCCFGIISLGCFHATKFQHGFAFWSSINYISLESFGLICEYIQTHTL